MTDETPKRTFKLVHEFPKGEEIQSMKQINGTIYIATTKSVYSIVDGRVVPIPYVLKR